ncbi:uncharacterized protein LOC127471786 [Manacus candei]|uniref:uncharacterized protein LOC127471786 n=1 Tax=Manacus candei TaxID=415023 RepID=UPI0022277264|nr:uncharacterized protein LOC127471786 [Manacus candei]
MRPLPPLTAALLCPALRRAAERAALLLLPAGHSPPLLAAPPAARAGLPPARPPREGSLSAAGRGEAAAAPPRGRGAAAAAGEAANARDVCRDVDVAAPRETEPRKCRSRNSASSQPRSPPVKCLTQEFAVPMPSYVLDSPGELNVKPDSDFSTQPKSQSMADMTGILLKIQVHSGSPLRISISYGERSRICAEQLLPNDKID